MDLQTFRACLDDTYTHVLASDSRTMAQLTACVRIGDECGSLITFFRLRSPGINLESQNIAQISRRYWEIVYGDAINPKSESD